MIHLDPGIAFEHLAHQIHDAARAGGAVEQRFFGLLGIFDEFFEIARRHRWVRQQQEGYISSDRNWYKVLLDIVT